MIQAIVAILIIFAISIIWSEVKQHREKTQKKQGDVIDISEAWIDSSHLPYRRRECLLNNAERNLYYSIQHVLQGSRYIVCPKVRLADIVDLPIRTKNRQEYLNRVRIRTVDLLICELHELSPVLALTLEGKSSARREKLSDQFTANALKASGLPHIVYNRLNLPDQDRLLSDLSKAGLILTGSHQLSE